MNLLDRQQRRPVQLDLGIEPVSFADAVGRVASELAVSPRTIATCSPIEQPDALLLAHSWVERCDPVVDVGCGLGGPAVFLHQMRSERVDLVEPDGPVAEHARSFVALDVVVSALDALPLADNDYGGAVALAPHGHGPERAGLLPELGRIVRSGGHVALWTCVSDTGEPFDSTRVRFPTLSQLEAELFAAGLAVESWASAGRFDVEPTWVEIQGGVIDQVSERFGGIPTIQHQLAERSVVVHGLRSGALTSLIYRLKVR